MEIKQLGHGNDHSPPFNKNKTKTNSVAFSPQVSYIDWATTTGQQILVPTFVDRGVSRGQNGRTSSAFNLSFLDWSCYFSFE
jgi:hypothetical protein